jgi:predicted metal-dependent hydrolase
MQIISQSQANPLNSSQFPYPYTVRMSKRARRLNLRILPDKGIILTIPQRVSAANALYFLEEHIEWVKKHAPLNQSAPHETVPPCQLDLPVMGQWLIEYENTLGRIMLIERAGNTLVYCGPDDRVQQLKKLRNWLQHRAATFLTQRLQELSQQCQLSFSSVTFRTQRTMWGSCSRTKKISLNYKLIFLSAELIDYVLIHELAHLRHLDHSPKFWRVVGEFYPEYAAAKEQLRKIEHTIPQWFYGV